MRVAGPVLALPVVLATGRTIALCGRDIELSWLTPFALFWQDGVVAIAFALLALGLRRRARVVAVLFWSLVALAALDAVLLRSIATPLTWPMVRAAGGPLADSIAHYVTPGNLAALVGLGVVAALCARTFAAARLRTLGCALALTTVLTGLGASQGRAVDTHGLHRNGVYVLATAAWSRVAARAPSSAADWRRVRAAAALPDLTPLRGTARDRNVVLVVLESVAAQYLRPYGTEGDADPMPNLSALAREAILFENAYAVYPESIKGLAALWHGVHPAMDTDAADYRDLDVPSLGALLAGIGHRTGLFHSGRFGYLGMEHVLARSGFATRVDAADISGEYDSSFGVADCDTADALLRWVDDRGDGERFFACFLPIAGHHPYDAPEPGPFGAREAFDAYRSAIWYADKALGRLVAGLRERRLWRQTLLVVVGDHGQAFGQHEANYGHTFFLYDENVRVPLLVVAPGLTDAGARVGRVASHVDVAPTILDLVGIDAPSGCEGRSLLGRTEAAALMFTDYSLPLLAIREGPWKCIVDLEADRARLFDLRTDPAERCDRAAEHPAVVAAFRERLSSWAAAQRGLIRH